MWPENALCRHRMLVSYHATHKGKIVLLNAHLDPDLHSPMRIWIQPTNIMRNRIYITECK
jgi:hypothetical protein